MVIGRYGELMKSYSRWKLAQKALQLQAAQGVEHFPKLR
jgi:hypothetical protein